MAISSEPVITEIHEDAYKQNSVYRPWSDIRTGTLKVVPTPQPARPRKTVAALNTLDQLSAAALR